jgi:Icc protein
VMQKVEGHVAFHTARSTAFPQGVPGVAKGPGPAPVPPGELKNFLGTTRISLVTTKSPLAIVDTPLAG